MAAEPSVETIYHAALERETGPERDAYLDAVCGAAGPLRARVEALLEADAAAEGFLEPGARAGAERVATRQIGPYRILEVLGHGAQATVYRAWDESLRRPVALKVLHRPLAASGDAAQRFRREAEVTAGVDHPGICGVYETGETDGSMWIAMQYVPGRTLADHLATGDDPATERSTLALPRSDDDTDSDASETSHSSSARRSELMRIVALIERAARALHVAHERGLVHRDIKPGNLMVTEDGRPVILDFGIARALDDGSAGAGLTRTTDVLGTPHYMPPEQLRGAAAVDRRTDVYALGVTLFECLTRRRPFDAPSVEALYRQILTTEPTGARSLDRQIPRDLEVVLHTALDKDPDRRYRTALAFAEDLRRVRQYEPIQARPISVGGRVVRWARRYPVVATSVSVAFVSLATGLAASLWFLGDAKDALAREQLAHVSAYDRLSRTAAELDVRGGSALLQPQLREQGLRILEASVPGLTARFEDEVRPQERGVRRDRAENLVGHLLHRGELLVAALPRVPGAARVCVADTLHLLAREITFGIGGDWNEESVPAAIRFAEQSLRALAHLEANDVRVVRARVLLLDALLEAARFDEVAARAESFLQSDRDAAVPRDRVRVALYESRLGTARLWQGEVAAAKNLLDPARSVHLVEGEYPRTWFAFDAQAGLLDLYDKTGDTGRAAPLRAELCRSLPALAADYPQHGSRYHLRAALGSHRRGLLAWWNETIQAAQRQQDSEFIDRTVARLHQLRREHGIEDDAPVLHLLHQAFAIAANCQAFYHGEGGAVTERLYRLGVDLAESLPPDESSQRTHGLTGLATVHFRRQELEAAERRFRQAMVTCRPGSLVHIRISGFLGRVLLRRGGYEEAEERLFESYQTNLAWSGPKNIEVHVAIQGLTGLYGHWGRPDDAARWHRRGLALQDHPNRRAAFGFTLLSFGRYDEAERELRSTLAVAPANHRAWRWQALNDLLRGAPDRAAELATAAAAQGDRQSLRVLARAVLARGDARGSIAHFEAAAQAAPSLVEGSGFWRDYGASLVTLGRPDDARAVLEALTDRAPRDPLAWAARAEFLATADDLSAAHRKQAVECAERALELAGRRRPHLLGALAEAQFRAGQPDAAVRTMTAVLRLMDAQNGRHAQWLSRADAHRKLRRYQEN